MFFDIQETMNLSFETKFIQQTIMHAKEFCSELYDKNISFHIEHVHF